MIIFIKIIKNIKKDKSKSSYRKEFRVLIAKLRNKRDPKLVLKRGV